MTETSVTKYMSARADGTEEKGPAMPRPRAPWEHREMQSRQRVQRLEMRAGPALARDGEVTAGGGALHAPGARLLHAHAPGGQPAQQTGGQPHGAKPAAIFPHAARGAHSPGQGSQESRGKRNRQGVFHRGVPTGTGSSGVPTAAARAAHLQSREALASLHRTPLSAGEAADRQSHTPK